MPKKEWTEEERKAFAEKMKAARAANQAKTASSAKKNPPAEKEAKVPAPSEEVDRIEGVDVQTLQKQIDEIMETNALLKAAFIRGGQTPPQVNQSPQINQKGNLIGVYEKYTLDPDNYPSPIERLVEEPRLAPLAFKYNYDMDYSYTTRQYDTKQGINTVEPEFTVTLYRKILDEEGNPTNRKYRARRMVFHEDPQAAMVIARDNGILIDQEDEKNFLNEMRYLRVRDWLFDIFWPKPAQQASKIREEVIGNQLVEVITVNSESSADLSEHFNKVTKKG